MKILLHLCCAPCAVYPVDLLRREGFTVMGFFTRWNIHPYMECMRREEAVHRFSELSGMRVRIQPDYDLEGFLRAMAFREANRCPICYHERLQAAAMIARRGKFDAFTTTLLYSKFQKHELIREIGEAVGRAAQIPFLYRDFRSGWKAGIEASKAMALYRQSYCGCIYSEKERYFRPSARPTNT